MIEIMCCFPGWPPSEYVDEEKRAELVKDIRVLYNVGVPFFTKRSLQEVAQQLGDRGQIKSRSPQKISTTGFNGQNVDFTIETRRVHFRQAGGDEELVLYAPI